MGRPLAVANRPNNDVGQSRLNEASASFSVLKSIASTRRVAWCWGGAKANSDGSMSRPRILLIAQTPAAKERLGGQTAGKPDHLGAALRT